MGTLATFAMVGSTVFAVAAEAQRIHQDPREGAPRHEEIRTPLKQGCNVQDERTASDCTAVATVRGESSDAFNGTWLLDRNKSDSPGPQLQALGVRWWMRKAAEWAQPRVTIAVDRENNVWNEHIDVGKIFQADDSFLLDGSVMPKNKLGYEVLEYTSVEENGDCVATRVQYQQGQGAGLCTEIRRYVVDGDKCGPQYMVQNQLIFPCGKVIPRTSYFSRC